MALPPTIPTSFVPRSATAPQHFRADLTGAYGFFAYILLGIAFLLALSVFFYGRLLTAERNAKDKSLQEEVSAIDPKVVDGFVRLRDRLNSGVALLNGHVAYSGFFSSLEKLLPTTVRFTSLHLSLDAMNVSRVEGTGVAKSFNALAAASSGFADDGRIKDAIFSNLTVNKDNSVTFSLTATLDPSIITFVP